MKNNILLFAIIFSYFSANSQKIKEKSITSKVKSATIFLNNAQVTRIKEVKLDQGIQLLKFIGLSPFIDKKSIQIKAKNIVKTASEIGCANSGSFYATGRFVC